MCQMLPNGCSKVKAQAVVRKHSSIYLIYLAERLQREFKHALLMANPYWDLRCPATYSVDLCKGSHPWNFFGDTDQRLNDMSGGRFVHALGLCQSRICCCEPVGRGPLLLPLRRSA